MRILICVALLAALVFQPADAADVAPSKTVSEDVAADSKATLPSRPKPKIKFDFGGKPSSLMDKYPEKYPVDSDEWLEADPLLIIDSEMNSVVHDMQGGDLLRPHSETQPKIIARFDRLIEMLERKKRGSGGGGKNPTQAAGDSTLSGGPKEGGALRAADDKPGAMNQLSGAERKKIDQAQADGFPPGFDDVLSDYYRRLAETRPAETSDGAGE